MKRPGIRVEYTEIWYWEAAAYTATGTLGHAGGTAHTLLGAILAAMRGYFKAGDL